VRGLTSRRLRAALTSLGNRIALLFFAITLLAIGTLYIYVAPGLRTRLVGEQLEQLRADALADSGAVARTVGTADSQHVVETKVGRAALRSGARVTLLSVSRSRMPVGPQLRVIADSSSPRAATVLGYPAGWDAARTGRVATATEMTRSGDVAESALPIPFGGTVVRVVVYSTPISNIVHSVTVVRHEILDAGVLALVLALIGGWLTARWLAQRVKRLERAAERVAAGEFEHPIPVDSRDELGQLAVAFNDMQRQLSQLESARKKFIATASHELRTPIFSLGGFVELLRDEDLDEDTHRRFLDLLAEQVERLRKLSVDLLDLSRLESGSLELRPEHVDLGELTRSVSAEFEPSLARHDSRLELRLSPRIEAQCDPVRIAQIMRILIDNALIHTGSGTSIVVTAARDNGSVRLAVRDDGQGIEGAALPRIFEPFYTADDAPGSGLGLTIASELAERMDGRLTVASSPGQTVFTLEIPA
jgi:signal transduction histidine kinase